MEIVGWVGKQRDGDSRAGLHDARLSDPMTLGPCTMKCMADEYPSLPWRIKTMSIDFVISSYARPSKAKGRVCHASDCAWSNSSDGTHSNWVVEAQRLLSC